jgi:ABC-type phosphate transport system permease subunit
MITGSAARQAAPLQPPVDYTDLKQQSLLIAGACVIFRILPFVISLSKSAINALN